MKFCIGFALGAMLWVSSAAGANRIVLGPPAHWIRPATIPLSGSPTQTPLKVLLIDREIRFSARAEEMYVENAVKIQTAEGLGAAGTIAIAWNPDTDRVTVHKLEILRNGQRIDVLATQKFTIARRETKMEYATLDGTLTGVIEPKGLQVGDVVDFAYTLRRKDPVLSGTSEATIGGVGTVAVSRLQIRAQWPTSLAIRWKASDGLKAIQTQQGGLTVVSVAEDDLQPVLQPRGAPARYLVDPRIELSSFGSWGDVAARLAPLYEKAAVIGKHSPLLAVIKRIRTTSPDPKERAAMALSLVENQVRYVYLGMNEGGLVPAPPDLTWSRRFGDCKAKTVLLMALLRSLGIDAVPVAVSTRLGALLPDRLPTVELLDHVLVRTVMGGKTYWLDGTRLGDGSLDNLPVPYYHWALPLTRRGSELERLVPASPADPLTDTSIRIDATAGITAPAPFHVETILRGDVGLATKIRLARLAPNQLDSELRQYWEGVYKFVTPRTVSASYDDVTATEHLIMDGTARMDWSGDQYETDGLGVGYQANFQRQPGPNQGAPYAVAYPFYSRATEAIRLPDDGVGFSIAGANVDRNVAGMEYHRQASLSNGIFTGVAAARSLVPEFPASEAQADQKELRDMANLTLYVEAPKGYSPTAADVAAGIPATATITDAGGFTSRGNLLLARQRYVDAIADFDAALALSPKDATTLADRAISYLYRHDPADGSRDLANARRIDPGNKYVAHGRGLLAMAKRDYRAAVEAFTKALKLDPKDVFALQMRSFSEVPLGDKHAAEADIDRAIRLSPKDPLLYWYRAVVLRTFHNKKAAMQQPRLLIKADPGDAAAYLAASQIYVILGEPQQARKAVDRSIRLKPTEAGYLARARQRSSTDLAGRRADLEAAVRLNPDSAGDLQLLAAADSDSGDYSQSVSVATRTMSISTETPVLLAIRGVGYFKTGRIKLAEQDFAAAAAKAKSAEDLNDACWRMAISNVALKRALSLCDAAVEKGGAGSARATYFDSRGFVLLRLGRCKEAIASYDSALAAVPLKPTSLYGRGLCELRMGDKQEGKHDMYDGRVFSEGAVAVEFEHYGVTSGGLRRVHAAGVVLSKALSH